MYKYHIVLGFRLSKILQLPFLFLWFNKKQCKEGLDYLSSLKDITHNDKEGMESKVLSQVAENKQIKKSLL